MPPTNVNNSLVTGLLTTGAVVTLAALIFGFAYSPAPPLINGTIIPDARPIDDFRLLDHHNNAFTPGDLQGNWHIVSYGYTHCPDICPTTLVTLAQVAKKLKQEPALADTRFVFYTVDPKRDTADHLANYLPWFDKEFIGLTHQAGSISHLPFEQSLGMLYAINPRGKSEEFMEDNYDVSHGVLLYVLNARGELQAVLKPESARETGGYTSSFSADVLYRDYKLIRGFTSGGL